MGVSCGSVTLHVTPTIRAFVFRIRGYVGVDYFFLFVFLKIDGIMEVQPGIGVTISPDLELGYRFIAVIKLRSGGIYSDSGKVGNQ